VNDVGPLEAIANMIRVLYLVLMDPRISAIPPVLPRASVQYASLVPLVGEVLTDAASHQLADACQWSLAGVEDLHWLSPT
jgi:hypothetical protein